MIIIRSGSAGRISQSLVGASAAAIGTAVGSTDRIWQSEGWVGF